MTREELNQKLLTRGATKAHLTSKVIPIMLEVFAEEVSPGEALACLQEIRDHDIDKFESEKWLFENEKQEVRNQRHALEVEKGKLEEWEQRLREREEFINESTLQLETSEARDKSKMALMYERMTRPDLMNEYQKTGYITGLALILSSDKQMPIKKSDQSV